MHKHKMLSAINNFDSIATPVFHESSFKLNLKKRSENFSLGEFVFK